MSHRITWIALVTLAGCALPVEGSPVSRERGAVEAADPSTSIVCWNQPRQSITGFGASSAWYAPNIPDELADQLFNLDGLGLSLLRLRIAPDGTSSEVATARKAAARGASVWAAPWSPPGEWKTNGSDRDGGSLLPEHYQAWADRLALFVRTLEEGGVTLDALSAQNEPDYTASWETCRWTPEELARFVADYLAPALAREGVAPRLIAPESANWNSISRYASALLGDPAAAAVLDIVATHSYESTAFAFRAPASAGKELWMTEWSDDETGFGDTGMASALVVARTMHQHLTVAEVNAWHYWWLVDAPAEQGPDTNAALVREGAITRRGYVMGQYSRFVRPGSTRLRVVAQAPAPGVSLTAFLDSSGSELALVAVNESSEPSALAVGLEGASVGDLVPWVTSETAALEERDVVLGGESVRYELEPRSVTTLVGPFTPGSTEETTTDSACEPFVPATETSDATGCACRQAGPAQGGVLSVFGAAALALLAARRRASSRQSASDC